MTQVMLDFPEERCGSGAVATTGIAHGLKLRWLTPRAMTSRYDMRLAAGSRLRRRLQSL
jgi:hypothetical protein